MTDRTRRHRVAALLRRDTGASALEMSILAPALLILVFVSVQVGLFFYGRAVAIQAAREGVSQLRVVRDARTAEDLRPQIESAVERYAVTVGRQSLLDPEVTTEYDEAGGEVSVTVTGSAITLWPGFDLKTTQRASGRIERFDAPGGAP